MGNEAKADMCMTKTERDLRDVRPLFRSNSSWQKEDRIGYWKAFAELIISSAVVLFLKIFILCEMSKYGDEISGRIFEVGNSVLSYVPNWEAAFKELCDEKYVKTSGNISPLELLIAVLTFIVAIPLATAFVSRERVADRRRSNYFNDMLRIGAFIGAAIVGLYAPQVLAFDWFNSTVLLVGIFLALSAMVYLSERQWDLSPSIVHYEQELGAALSVYKTLETQSICGHVVWRYIIVAGCGVVFAGIPGCLIIGFLSPSGLNIELMLLASILQSAYLVFISIRIGFLWCETTSSGSIFDDVNDIICAFYSWVGVLAISISVLLPLFYENRDAYNICVSCNVILSPVLIASVWSFSSLLLVSERFKKAKKSVSFVQYVIERRHFDMFSHMLTDLYFANWKIDLYRNYLYKANIVYYESAIGDICYPQSSDTGVVPLLSLTSSELRALLDVERGRLSLPYEPCVLDCLAMRRILKPSDYEREIADVVTKVYLSVLFDDRTYMSLNIPSPKQIARVKGHPIRTWLGSLLIGF